MTFGLGDYVRSYAASCLTIATLLVCAVVQAQNLQLRNCNVLEPVFDLDYAKPAGLLPVSLAGARNGSFSAKVVLSSKQPIRGVRATMSDLVGPGKISASSVDVRYALFRAPGRGLSVAFDALSPTPPEETPVATKRMFGRLWQARSPGIDHALQPIWIIVNVPANAKPGDYTGTLTITAPRKRVFRVPVMLHVAAWTLPDPTDFRTFAELIQSPESVAMFYDVPLWSQKHFKLMAQSFRLMRLVGNKTLYLPLICETNHGNAESMVRWMRRPDGSYTHDFTILERILDLAVKEMGKPRFLCLWVWDNFLEGGQFSGDIKYESKEVRETRLQYRGKGPEVTAVDADGETRKERLPVYADAKSRALWQPVMTGVRRRLKQRGFDKEIVLGMVTDTSPAKSTVELFKTLMPGTLWMRRGHMRRKSVHGVSLALQMGPSYNTWAYSTNPPEKRLYGWRGVKWRYPGWSVHFPRAWWTYVSLCRYRMVGEVNIAGNQRGFGGLGADFWPVLKDKRGRQRGTLSARYPKSSWRNLNIRATLFWPGPEGAANTTRFQMLREGMQECEARIVIEEALLTKRIRGRLASRAQTLLDERIHALKKGMPGAWPYGGHWSTVKSEFPAFIHGGWEKRSRTLFDMAAEVRRAR